MANPDSDRMTVRCPCGAKLKLPVAAARRRARCPKCKEVFTIPDVPAEEKDIEPVMEPDQELTGKLSAFEELAEQERTAAATSSPDLGRMQARCPKCGTAIPANATLCVQCGYNIETGQQAKGASVRAAWASAAAHRIAAGAGGFFLGCVLSAVGALIGAALWAGITIASDYEIGWIAWILGLLAGGGMVLGYREKNLRAGIVAAGIAVLGIAAARIMIFVFMLSSAIGEFAETRDFKEVVLAIHVVQLETYEKTLPPWEHDRWGEMIDQKRQELSTLGDPEFTQAWESFQEWSTDAKWQDEEFVHAFLIDCLAQQGLPDDLGDEPPISLEEWEERRRTATAEVDVMSTVERVERAKKIKVGDGVALDVDEIETSVKESFEEAATQDAQEETSWIELFVSSPIDILFILLALASAFKLASGGGDD